MGQEFGQSVTGSSSSTDCHQVSVKAGVLSEGSAGEGSAPKPTWLLPRFSTLQAVGLRASVPRWLLCPKSPSGPGGPLHKWDRNTATGFIRQQGRVAHTQASVSIFFSHTFSLSLCLTHSNSEVSLKSVSLHPKC